MRVAQPKIEASASRDRIKWSLLVFAAALLARVVALAPLVGTPLLDTIMGDALNYEPWARRIASGDWLGSEVFYQAPLYPYFLALIDLFLGGDPLVVRSAQILIGSSACGLLVLAGWRWFSKPVGIAAGLMLALYAPALFADLTIQKSVLDVFFVSLMLWQLGVLVDQPSLGRCAGLGATLGLLILSRENALIFALVLGAWMLLRLGDSPRERLRRAGLFAAGLALILLPVTLRNAYVGGEFHLTTSQFGHNFYIGNNATADGTYRPLIARRGDPRIERQDATDLAERAVGHELTPAGVSDFYTARALDYIRSQPFDWLSLMARKLALAFNAVEWVDTKDQYSYGAQSPLLWLSDRVFHFGVLAPLAWLGALVTWPARRRLLPLYWIYVAYTGGLLVFYIFSRYRLPTIPILMLFAAAGAMGARSSWSGSESGRKLALAGSLLAFAVFCNWPLASRSYMRSVTQYNLANALASSDHVEEAIDHYREAILLFGANARAHHNLGSLLATRGDFEAAIEHFGRAIEIDPGYAQAFFNRARALRERGDDEAALGSYTHGLEIEPARADLQLELGLYCEALGRHELAAARLERALALDPTNEPTRQALLRVRAKIAATR